MNLFDWFGRMYEAGKANRWCHGFAIFCRLALAVAFIISGIVKVSGERFAAGLSVNHPLGHYFDALHQTGYYYTFIGIGQIIIALLLVIPKTAFLGALMYFPVVLNICVLTYSVRFEGTRGTTLMLLANIFLLLWDYKRLRMLISLGQANHAHERKPLSRKFPYLFFSTLVMMIAAVVIVNQVMYEIRPGNCPEECTNGCATNSKPRACMDFCHCIHQEGKPLSECLSRFERMKTLK